MCILGGSKEAMKTVILSSQNKGKIKEIRAILEKYDMDVISRDDAGIPSDEIEETGSTFEENSYIKAAAIRDMIDADPNLARYASSPVIADDSGLMVDALGGAPGVYSARYAGEGCTFEDDIRKLLGELEGVPEEERTAKFVTVITMIYPNAEDAPSTASEEDGRYVLRAYGECKGHITEAKAGDGGFGYDPVFIPEGNDKTFAELGTDFKNTISHRAKALAQLESKLKEG